MNEVRREQINDLADLVRRACKVDVPTNEAQLGELIHRLGGNYEVCTQLDYEAMIQKTSETGFNIQISKDFMPSRRKFSIAHELGHLFLHMGFAIDPELWASWDDKKLFRDSARDRLGRTEEESEANEFAAALLMPRSKFVEVAKECYDDKDGVFKVDEIAAHFEVSLQAALTRGRWLGLFSWA